MVMDNANKIEYWLAVHHAPELSKQLPALMDRYGDVRSLCESCRLKNGRTPAALIREPDENYRRDLHWARQTGHQTIAYDQPAYPSSLRDLPMPPALLFALGDVSLLSEPQITVVGSRRPSFSGMENAKVMTRDLAQSGLLITSGLADGIDTLAHQTALDVGTPTIAVVGTGLDFVYPAKNKMLAQNIAAQGLLLSEFSCATPPHARNFPQRNRVMAALSLGVLVVEAAERSGSLITARLAAEYGREVFAVPGSIRNPCARGCHRLIRDGAHLVESADEILLELALALQPSMETRKEASSKSPDAKQETEREDLPPDHQSLLDNMAYDEPASVDDLVERSGLTAAEVASILLILELEGWVRSSNQVYVRIK